MFKKLSQQFNRLQTGNLMRGAFQVIALRIAGVAFLFGITLFLTNFYSASQVGTYEFVRSALFLIGGFTMLGTDQAILFFSGRFSKPDQVGALFKVYFKMLLLLFVVSLLFLVIILSVPSSTYQTVFNDARSGSLLVKVGCCLFFYAVTLFNTEFFRAFNQHAKSELYRGIIKQLPFGIGVLFLFVLKQPQFLVEVFLGGFFFCAVVSWLEVFLHYKRFTVPKFKMPAIKLRTVLSATLPIAMSALGFYLLISIDVFFLKRYTNFETLAYYGTSIKIIFLISTVINVIGSFLAVRIADLYVTNHQELQCLLKTGVRVIVVFSTLLSVLLFIFSAEILSIFGAEYQQATLALRILILGHFMATLCGTTQVYLNMTKKQVVLQYILILAVIINCLLNWKFIPVYEIEGAATASAISVLFWNVAAVVWVYKKDRIKLFLH